MSLRRFTKREQSIFVVLVLAACVCFVYYGIINPFLAKKDDLEVEIQAKEKLYHKYVRTIAQAKALEKENKALLDSFQQNDTNEQVMSQILSEIERQAGDLGLKISDLKPRRVKKETYANRFSVSLSTESSMTGMLKFLYTLQKEPHLFEVDEFSIDKGMQGQGGVVKVNLVLSKIYIPQP